MGPIKILNGGNYAHQVKKLFRDRIISIIIRRIVLKSIQKFDSHVKFFLIVVSFQAARLLVIIIKNGKLYFFYLHTGITEMILAYKCC